MARATAHPTPGFSTLTKFIATQPIERSTEYFISLLRARQVRGSKPCAIATAYFLRKLIDVKRVSDATQLIQLVQSYGKRLIDAAPREHTIGNVVRRVLGLIRDEVEEDRDDDGQGTPGWDPGSIPPTPGIDLLGQNPFSAMQAVQNGVDSPRRQVASPPPQTPPTGRPALVSTQTGAPGTTRAMTSMFSIMAHPTMRQTSSPLRSGASTPGQYSNRASYKLRDEVLEGMAEILDELEQSDEQIANFALEHVYASETIFTYSSSVTVQQFLLKAASKRKFTVIHAEAYPNTHRKTHAMIMGNTDADEDLDLSIDSFQKPLTAAGITVILIPDSAIFAMISRASKVILGAHSVLSNGAVIAVAGTKSVIKAAKYYRIPVMVLAGTYKLSPEYPHDPQQYIEYGDVQKVMPFQDRELRQGFSDDEEWVPGLDSIKNPIFDFVEAGDVDLFVTNLGGISTGYLYRVIRDQYREEDMEM